MGDKLVTVRLRRQYIINIINENDFDLLISLESQFNGGSVQNNF